MHCPKHRIVGSLDGQYQPPSSVSSQLIILVLLARCTRGYIGTPRGRQRVSCTLPRTIKHALASIEARVLHWRPDGNLPSRVARTGR